MVPYLIIIYCNNGGIEVMKFKGQQKWGPKTKDIQAIVIQSVFKVISTLRLEVLMVIRYLLYLLF